MCKLALPLLGAFLALAGLVATSCSSGGSSGGPDSDSSTSNSPATVLNFICVREDRFQWTWATSSAAVLRYYVRGAAAPACQIITDLLAPGDCCSDPEPCNFGGTQYNVQQALQLYGNLGSVITPQIAFETLKTEIDAGRPIMIVYSNSFEGHIVVVYGYDENSQEIYLCDPFFGDFVVPYDVTFSYTAQALNWGTTIMRIQ